MKTNITNLIDCNISSQKGVILAKLIRNKRPNVFAKIGVPEYGFPETLLNNSIIEKLYCIDTSQNFEKQKDSLDINRTARDELHSLTHNGTPEIGRKTQIIRASSQDAIKQIPEELDFIYLDADHSYQATFSDICLWFNKIRVGGIIGGHDYGHVHHPGVKRAVDQFFRRFGWQVHLEGEGVWWVQKQKLNISFIMGIWNGASTLEEAIQSIFTNNFSGGDELIVVDDGSSDNSVEIVTKLASQYPIRLIQHPYNLGGGRVHNTAIEAAKHPLIYSLDCDNILEDASIQQLKQHFITSGADIASFGEMRCFQKNRNNFVKNLRYKNGPFTLQDCLNGLHFPGSGGNNLYTKELLRRVNGFPEYAGAMENWGFGLNALVAGALMIPMPESYYYHRLSDDSYWMRDANKPGWKNKIALQILIPHLDLLNLKSRKWILSEKGRFMFFDYMQKRPLQLRTDIIFDELGYHSPPWKSKFLIRVLRFLIRKLKNFFGR